MFWNFFCIFRESREVDWLLNEQTKTVELMITDEILSMYLDVIICGIVSNRQLEKFCKLFDSFAFFVFFSMKHLCSLGKDYLQISQKHLNFFVSFTIVFILTSTNLYSQQTILICTTTTHENNIIHIFYALSLV